MSSSGPNIGMDQPSVDSASLPSSLGAQGQTPKRGNGRGGAGQMTALSQGTGH